MYPNQSSQKYARSESPPPPIVQYPRLYYKSGVGSSSSTSSISTMQNSFSQSNVHLVQYPSKQNYRSNDKFSGPNLLAESYSRIRNEIKSLQGDSDHSSRKPSQSSDKYYRESPPRERSRLREDFSSQPPSPPRERSRPREDLSSKPPAPPRERSRLREDFSSKPPAPPRERSQQKEDFSSQPPAPPPPSMDNNSPVKTLDPLSSLLDNKNVSLSSLLEAAMDPSSTGSSKRTEDPIMKKTVLDRCEGKIAQLYRRRISGMGTFFPLAQAKGTKVTSSSSAITFYHPRIEFNMVPFGKIWTCSDVNVEFKMQDAKENIEVKNEENEVSSEGRNSPALEAAELYANKPVPDVIIEPQEPPVYIDLTEPPPSLTIPLEVLPPRQHLLPQQVQQSSTDNWPPSISPFVENWLQRDEGKEHHKKEKSKDRDKKKKKRRRSRSSSSSSRSRSRSQSRRRRKSRSRNRSRNRSRSNYRTLHRSRSRSRRRKSRSRSISYSPRRRNIEPRTRRYFSPSSPRIKSPMHNNRIYSLEHSYSDPYYQPSGNTVIGGTTWNQSPICTDPYQSGYSYGPNGPYMPPQMRDFSQPISYPFPNIPPTEWNMPSPYGMQPVPYNSHYPDPTVMSLHQQKEEHPTRPNLVYVSENKSTNQFESKESKDADVIVIDDGNAKVVYPKAAYNESSLPDCPPGVSPDRNDTTMEKESDFTKPMRAELRKLLNPLEKVLETIKSFQRNSFEYKAMIEGLECGECEFDGVYTLLDGILCKLVIDKRNSARKSLKVVIPAVHVLHVMQQIHSAYHDYSELKIKDIIGDVFYDSHNYTVQKIASVIKACKICKAKTAIPVRPTLEVSLGGKRIEVLDKRFDEYRGKKISYGKEKKVLQDERREKDWKDNSDKYRRGDRKWREDSRLSVRDERDRKERFEKYSRFPKEKEFQMKERKEENNYQIHELKSSKRKVGDVRSADGDPMSRGGNKLVKKDTETESRKVPSGQLIKKSSKQTNTLKNENTKKEPGASITKPERTAPKKSTEQQPATPNTKPVPKIGQGGDKTTKVTSNVNVNSKQEDFKVRVRRVQMSLEKLKNQIEQLEGPEKNSDNPCFLLKGGMLCQRTAVDEKTEVKIAVTSETLLEMVQIVHTMAAVHAPLQKTIALFKKHFTPIENLDKIAEDVLNNCGLCKCS